MYTRYLCDLNGRIALKHSGSHIYPLMVQKHTMSNLSQTDRTPDTPHSLHVHSETGQLEAVIVHTPGREVSLVNPEFRERLLFDDIIFEADARQEHLDMIEIFRTAIPDPSRTRPKSKCSVPIKL